MSLVRDGGPAFAKAVDAVLEGISRNADAYKPAVVEGRYVGIASVSGEDFMRAMEQLGAAVRINEAVFAQQCVCVKPATCTHFAVGEPVRVVCSRCQTQFERVK